MFREILEIMVETIQDFVPQTLCLSHGDTGARQLISLGLYYLIHKMENNLTCFLLVLL